MKKMISEIRMAVVATLSLAVVLCGVYPLVVWGLSQGLFPYEANGSLILRNGEVVGSELIAQGFTSSRYFHPRPSSAGETGYDAGNSFGSNLGPLSQKLIDAVKERVEAYRAENHLLPEVPVPADAATASGSGLDPHIGVRNAQLQAPRVAKARGVSEASVRRLIEIHIEGRDLGIFGEPRVNLLQLNLALDKKM
jgi:K+-transporting ATPase ATPase C chain